MRDFAARASTSFAEGACCVTFFPSREVRSARRDRPTMTTTFVVYVQNHNNNNGHKNESGIPLGKKRGAKFPPIFCGCFLYPLFFTKQQQQQQQPNFFLRKKEEVDDQFYSSTTNNDFNVQTTWNHFVELQQREDDDDHNDNADLLLFSFFPSLIPLVVVNVPLFVERRACE